MREVKAKMPAIQTPAPAPGFAQRVAHIPTPGSAPGNARPAEKVLDQPRRFGL